MRRGAALALLVSSVTAVHGLVASWLVEQLAPPGGDASAIRRIDIAFVRELQPAAPPPPPSPAPERRPQAVMPPAKPASAPFPEQPLPAAVENATGSAEPALPRQVAAAGTPADVVPRAEAAGHAAADAESTPAVAPEPGPASAAAGPMPSALAPPAGTASAAAPGSGSVAAFEWPPSTRLSYTMVGDYRGPVHGSAQVEWLRRADRYQVHLEVRIPGLLSRRMSSEGRLTDQGLAPTRYEELTELLFAAPRRLSMRFEPDRVVLANGQVQPALPGVQDTASQFVQLTWLFTTRSELLRLGQTIEVPLALPRRVDRWLYDIHAEEEVDTPVGRLRAFHMKPRRVPPPQGALSVETWFAPSLQYLPVRIVIRQDEQTHVDLTLSRAPQQEAGVRIDEPRRAD